MSLIADLMMALAALGAGIYCFVLSRRLSKFTNLESGMGGAVAVLAVQVDDLTKALEAAQATTKSSQEELSGLVARAEEASSRLELLMASLHDLPDASPQQSSRSVRRTRRSLREDA